MGSYIFFEPQWLHSAVLKNRGFHGTPVAMERSGQDGQLPTHFFAFAHPPFLPVGMIFDPAHPLWSSFLRHWTHPNYRGVRTCFKVCEQDWKSLTGSRSGRTSLFNKGVAKKWRAIAHPAHPAPTPLIMRLDGIPKIAPLSGTFK